MKTAQKRTENPSPLHYVHNANASFRAAACGVGIATRALPQTYTESPHRVTCEACLRAMASSESKLPVPK